MASFHGLHMDTWHLSHDTQLKSHVANRYFSFTYICWVGKKESGILTVNGQYSKPYFY